MALTSSLSVLSDAPSTPSFYTARASPAAGDTTAASGPLEWPEHSYRDAVQVPHELKQHCQIHFEERLYSSALQLLDSLLTARNSRLAYSAPSRPVFIPPPSQIALLGTLAIHPSFTTRPREEAHLQVSSQALQYLRNLCDTVGPVNANLRAAFCFRRAGVRGGRRGGGGLSSRYHDAGDGGWDDGGDEWDADHIDGPLAHELSVWWRAPDFWAAVGWAFRCSVEHPHRWRYWKAWLECVLDILEADWDERLRLDEQRRGGEAAMSGRGGSDREEDGGDDDDGDDEPHDMPHLEDSLLVMYLSALRRERKNTLREVLRAIFAFADGTVGADAAVYKEVFPNEAATRSSRGKRKRAATLDLEHNNFGDYLDDEDDDDGNDGSGGVGGDLDGLSSPPNNRGGSPTPGGPKTRRRGRPRREETPPPGPPTTAGVAESVPIRLRLFALLSAACFYLPEASCPAPLDELYDRVSDAVRGLPLASFRLFVASHATPLRLDVYTTLMRHVADKLLPSHRPDPQDVDPETESCNGVSVALLRRCLLPFAADRIFAEDNAKLALALEHMVRFLFMHGGDLDDGDDGGAHGLREAAERGVRAREARLARRGGGGGGSGGGGRGPRLAEVAEAAAREVLEESNRNLMVLANLMDPPETIEVR